MFHEKTVDTDINDINDGTQPPKGKKAAKMQEMQKRGKIEYDIPQIKDFFDVVFHSLTDDENILAWAQATNTPSFPKKLDATLNKVEKTKLAKACYFGTSTVSIHEDGNLYNRKEVFKRLHVVVLDDIGTKVLESSLPENLVPNYIIETSEGNYQWGFVLDTPIENYELAEALIHLVYTSGYSDTGGKMPTKVVRMPCGINGKKGDKGDFHVKLIEINNDYWTPAELVEVLDSGVAWADVEEDIDAAKTGKSSRFTGTSLWSPIKATASSLNGVVDPVLEWFYEQGMVKNDNGDWVTIQCPWAHEHSDGDGSAGYSPIGRGGEYSNRRSFHCFHEHCVDRKAVELLQVISQESGIQVPVVDNVADLVADYAYVSSEDSAYRVRGVNRPVGMKINAFKNTHSKKVAVYDESGKQKLIAESALWLTSPSRLIVQGLTCDPASRQRIVEHDGLKYLNTYAEPQWGKGSYADEDVEMFKQFVDYLIPIEDERDYFMQWLSAKAQDPTFKGAAVLMVAPTQGTGRTTLTDMVSTLFTANNVKKVTFPQLCAATESGAFNDWMTAGIVTCDEIMSHTHNKHKIYESLKDLFDPRPKSMVINAKYGAQQSVVVYSSYLLMTNHIDAIGSLGDDRRVYVIQNTLLPNASEYFVKLNEWLSREDVAGNPKWARSVWRWLQTLAPDLPMLHAPAPSTSVKDAMIDATKSQADMAAVAIFDAFKQVIPSTNIEKIARSLFEFRLEDEAKKLAHIVDRICKNSSQATSLRATVDGKQSRFRVSHTLLKSKGIGNLTKDIEDIIKHDLADNAAPTCKAMATDFDGFIRDLSDSLDDLML